MKRLLLIFPVRRLLNTLLLLTFTGQLAGSVKSEPSYRSNSDDGGAYSADVIDKWLMLQMRLMRDDAGIPNVTFSRYYAYSGIVALETLEPGIEKDFYNFNRNRLMDLPITEMRRKYFWPASVNAGLATINRNMFLNASAENKSAIDSLETALNNSFSQVNADVIERSNSFGNSVGAAILKRAETDDCKNVGEPYASPVGPGL